MHEFLFIYSKLGVFIVFIAAAMLGLALLIGRYRKTQMELLLASSEQKMHAKIEAAHKYLEDMLNHIPDPIFMKDRQHRWIGGNKAFWELMKGPPEKFLGKTDYEFFPKNEADVFWQQDDKVFTSGEIDVNRESFTDANGLRHTFMTKKIAFVDDKGEQFLVGVINDITAAIVAEEKMALLASIVESSDDAIISKTMDGVISSWNAGAERLFGYKAAEAVGQHINLIIPEGRQEEERYIIEQLRQGKRIEHYETVRVGKTGRPVDVWLTVSPICDSSGQTIGASKIIHDITDRKEAEAKLLRYTRELERSNQELDDFAYIASHDLKEPLRGLFNHASFLLEDYEGKLDVDGVHRLQRLAHLSQRMEHLVNDLLYFSRLGRTELAIQEIDPNSVIVEIGQMMESFLAERNARIVVPKPMPSVVCDRPRITEVFRNLITNAVKYNDKPERIVEVGFLETADSPQGMKNDVFYVKDNGIGIEPEFYTEIFRIFKRLQKTEGEKESGTGVGLTFVKKIVERHKGTIWLDSVPGRGTTFFFTLR